MNSASLKNGKIYAKIGSGGKFSATLKEVKKIDGRVFETRSRSWIIPKTDKAVKALQAIGYEFEGEGWGIKEKSSSLVIKKIDKSLLDPRLFPYQVEGVEFLEACDGNGGLGDQMGLGKGLLHGTKILEATGWKSIEDVKVGDMVFGSDGRLYAVEGVFPQGVRDTYEVAFNDGTSVITDDEHLWEVEHVRNAWNRPKLMSTYQMYQNVTDTSGNCNWRIPVTKPIRFSNKEQPLHPYILGAFLGDGSMTGYGISFTNPEKEIVDLIKTLIPSDCHFARCRNEKEYSTSGLTKYFREIGVYGCRSWEKYIPEMYLFGSVRQRLELLRGLMDTDGYCLKDSTAQFSSSSEELADNVQFLVESLGGVARRSVKQEPKYKYNGEIRIGRPAYILTISIPVNPFWYERKADRWHPRQKYKPTRIVKSIIPKGKGKTTCIRIGSPDHLFITEHCIVTHNTAIAVQYFKLHPEIRPILIVCPASIKHKWQREVWKWGEEESYIWPEGKDIKNAIHIINYEQLAKYEETDEQKKIRAFQKKLKKLSYTKKEINAQVKQQYPYPNTNPKGLLAEYGFKLIITDECQFLCNFTTIRTRMFVQIVRQIPRFVPISGTPIRSNPSEFFVVLHALDPERFPDRWKFLHKFSNAKHTHFGWTFKGGRNLDELHEIVKTLFIRHEKKEVWKQMPPKRKMIIPLDLDDVAGDAYWNADAEFMEWVSDTNRKMFETKNKLALLRQLAYQAKRESLFIELDQWIEQNPGEKIVLFSYHKKTMADIMNRYGDIAVQLNGSTPVKNRQGLIDQFDTDPKIRIFSGQIIAAGTGIDLVAASTVAFIEMWWVPADMEQCEDRLQRRGQKAKHIDVIYYVAENTIEDDMALAMTEKYKIVTEILDGKSDAEFFDVDFLDIVLQMRKNKSKKKVRKTA